MRNAFVDAFINFTREVFIPDSLESRSLLRKPGKGQHRYKVARVDWHFVRYSTGTIRTIESGVFTFEVILEEVGGRRLKIITLPIPVPTLLEN
jgi:hypothetical protein